MNKLISVALAVFLFVAAIQALANPEEIKIVARSKGLPPLVARQDPGYGDATPVDTPVDTPTSTSDSPLAKLTGLPKVPGAIPPASPVDTGVKTTPAVSASASAPSGAGSLIPQWSSLVAGGGATPSAQPTAPPTLPATTPKAAVTPSSADRLESGLIGVVIAGVVSLLF